MRVTIIIDEEDSGYVSLSPIEGTRREKLSAAAAIVAGQVLPAMIELAVSGVDRAYNLRWPMTDGGKVGYIIVEGAIDD